LWVALTCCAIPKPPRFDKMLFSLYNIFCQIRFQGTYLGSRQTWRTVSEVWMNLLDWGRAHGGKKTRCPARRSSPVEWVSPKGQGERTKKLGSQLCCIATQHRRLTEFLFESEAAPERGYHVSPTEFKEPGPCPLSAQEGGRVFHSIHNQSRDRITACPAQPDRDCAGGGET